MNCPGRAAIIGGYAQRLREQIGTPVAPIDQTRNQSLISAARAAVGDHDDASFEAAWADGRAMTMDQAVTLALDPGGRELSSNL
jgi:hypothetical protein